MSATQTWILWALFGSLSLSVLSLPFFLLNTAVDFFPLEWESDYFISSLSHLLSSDLAFLLSFFVFPFFSLFSCTCRSWGDLFVLFVCLPTWWQTISHCLPITDLKGRMSRNCMLIKSKSPFNFSVYYKSHINCQQLFVYCLLCFSYFPDHPLILIWLGNVFADTCEHHVFSFTFTT